MKRSALKISIMTACIFPLLLNGQAQTVKDLNTLIGIPLETAQSQLKEMGYEIAHSSLFKKDQLWYNESKGQCIEIKFTKKGDHLVESVEPGDEDKCIAGVEAARKIWENYHDGQSDANSDAINSEREKLVAQGLKATYWVNDVSPGKTMEVWWNESDNTCKQIVWDTASKGNVKVMDRDPQYAKNPAPKLD